MFQHATPLRKSAPWTPNISAKQNHIILTSSIEHFWLWNVLRATTACTFSTSRLPKVVQTCQFLTLLTSKCASRHNAMHFFNITTSKSGPKPLIFSHSWLWNVLRATTACTFSTSQFLKVLRNVLPTFWLRHVLRTTMACNCSSLIRPDGSAPAALASLLLDPPEPQIIGKTEWFATFLPFCAPASFFFGCFSSLIFFLLLFSSLTLPTSVFSSVHIVGSLTSKLSSTMLY